MLMDAIEILGKNIRKIREQRGWSQEELSHRSGIHRTYISGVERGARNPTLSVIEIIAVSLDLSVAQLLKEPM